MSEWIERTTREFRDAEWVLLPEGVRGRIQTFAADVVRFGRSQNLVSRQDPEGEVAKLVEESVRGGALLRSEATERMLEIGSGAGFPGLVVASLFPDADFVLVERRRARCDFLERCVRRLELEKVEVLAADVRSLQRPAFDVVMGKAVAESSTFLGWADAHLAPNGTVLLFQREGWNPPEGWSVEETVVSLRGEEGASRIACRVRRDGSLSD